MSRKEDGLLLRLMESIVVALVRLSVGKKLETRHADLLDIYIVSWIGFEIVILAAMGFTEIGFIAGVILSVLLSYHLFEIGVTSFNSVIIIPIMGKKHRSVPRLFTLILVNYIEIILIFGIFFNILIMTDPVLKNLNMSVSLATLAGSSISRETTAIFITSIAEMLFGLFFIAGAIAAISNYLGSKE